MCLGYFQYYIVVKISTRERESCQETEIFNETLIPFYNWDIPIGIGSSQLDFFFNTRVNLTYVKKTFVL